VVADASGTVLAIVDLAEIIAAMVRPAKAAAVEHTIQIEAAQ